MGLWILTFVRMTGFCWSGCGCGFATGRLGCLVRGGCPTLAVILTEVRIQGYGWGRLGLWVLTFVRMTGLGEVGVVAADRVLDRLGMFT